ncbi:hypothetical protein K6W17_08205 [Burkholderia dolosa]|nr:hypothetical protein [Burkholderia dolosa]
MLQPYGASIGRTEQNINRRLSSYLRDKVCPAPGERAVPQRYRTPARTENAEIIVPLYLNRDIKHIRSGWCELNVNFEASVLNSAMHDNLHGVNLSLARMQFNLLTT